MPLSLKAGCKIMIAIFNNLCIYNTYIYIDYAQCLVIYINGDLYVCMYVYVLQKTWTYQKKHGPID